MSSLSSLRPFFVVIAYFCVFEAFCLVGGLLSYFRPVFQSAAFSCTFGLIFHLQPTLVHSGCSRICGFLWNSRPVLALAVSSSILGLFSHQRSPLVFSACSLRPFSPCLVCGLSLYALFADFLSNAAAICRLWKSWLCMASNVFFHLPRFWPL